MQIEDKQYMVSVMIFVVWLTRSMLASDIGFTVYVISQMHETNVVCKSTRYRL